MIRFSLVGPLRTGSSLLSRCLDDHPELICLCESEINRALFGEYYLKLHFQRMRKHGLHPFDIMGLLDRKEQDSVADFERWNDEAYVLLKKKYGKPEAVGFGDKSPDFYRTPVLCDHVISEHRLIYTIRDPRAVFRSIQADDTSQIEKDRRWLSFLENFRHWKQFLRRENVLIMKFEDLVSDPEQWMNNAHAHLGVSPSDRYRETFPRAFPERFLWKGVTERANEGVSFSADKSDRWKYDLAEEEILQVEKSDAVHEIMARFGYLTWHEMASVT